MRVVRELTGAPAASLTQPFAFTLSGPVKPGYREAITDAELTPNIPPITPQPARAPLPSVQQHVGNSRQSGVHPRATSAGHG